MGLRRGRFSTSPELLGMRSRLCRWSPEIVCGRGSGFYCLPPGREGPALDITPAGMGGSCGSCGGTTLQPGENESLGSPLGLCCHGRGRPQCVCFFSRKCSSYYINVFWFAMLLFSWFFDRAGTFFYQPLLAFLGDWLLQLCVRVVCDAQGKPRDLIVASLCEPQDPWLVCLLSAFIVFCFVCVIVKVVGCPEVEQWGKVLLLDFTGGVNYTGITFVDLKQMAIYFFSKMDLFGNSKESQSGTRSYGGPLASVLQKSRGNPFVGERNLKRSSCSSLWRWGMRAPTFSHFKCGFCSLVHYTFLWKKTVEIKMHKLAIKTLMKLILGSVTCK